MKPLHPDESASDIVAIAERAATVAAEGRIEEARAGIADALAAAPSNLRVLFLGFQFHFRIGELYEAERLVRLRLAVAGPETDSVETARAYTNLGLIHHHRRDFAAAEREMTRALTIDERIVHEEGIARDMGNLGLVCESRGELDRAEQWYLKSLAIAQRIGAEQIAANKLANLGDIARTRGRNAEARDLWTRAVAIFERLGIKKQSIEFRAKLAELEHEGR